MSSAQQIDVIHDTVDMPQPASNVAMIATPTQLLAMAVQQGADLEKLEKLMELKERWEANEARKAFNEAVAEFKKNPPDIIKDKKNNQYNSMYATLANLANNGSAALAPFGLTVDWKIDQAQQIKVTCILKHALGHREEVTIQGPPDESGAKNKLQQIKSTITYLKGETFQCVTGITARDCPGDNDGNKAGPQQASRQQPTYNGRPTDGAWEAMSQDEQAFLLKMAAEVSTRCAADSADAFDYLESQQLSTDEKAALWTRLESKVRTALKKAHEAKRKAG